ncbi:four-carbon acid sugar kinase family protein [uncultured Pseudokineococcus sp.]|uniref:four-carbon acid sugar kinase family protein n=1 Tax=uncultured Pseudokineococcus sp. TaxID=1642928 RepID=UPI00262D4B1F|nr:four-carbon acid sugar kinase family protein [uncultured Pseudokineococcus sp.]
MELDDVLRGAPPEAGVTAAQVAEAVRGAGTTLVVLDDDPTGTQSVADLPVLTRWEHDDLAWALEGGPALYVLTNSRSLDPASTAERTREVVRTALAAAGSRGERVTFLSRSDSTLRGHFPLETDVIAEELEAAGHARPDLVLLAPAFPDAGRVTVDGVHWTREGGRMVPVGESEFAGDATFGYRSSSLPEWVAEKTGGAVAARDVVVLDLATVRRGPDAVADLLRGAPPGSVVSVDAATQGDLQSTALACARLEGEGRTLVYRTGPAFVRARVGQDAPAVVRGVDVGSGSGGGGLVVVGSHTGLTTRQRDRLVRARPSTEVVELSVPVLVDDASRDGHLEDAVARVVEALGRGDVLVQTSRDLVTGDDASSSLALSRTVSSAVVDLVARVLALRPPRFVVAKGGITSHDVATRGLGISRAVVRGPMLPGLVSLWEPVDGPAAGVPYVVFPGNVGDDDGLAQVVERLAGDAPG